MIARGRRGNFSGSTSVCMFFKFFKCVCLTLDDPEKRTIVRVRMLGYRTLLNMCDCLILLDDVVFVNCGYGYLNHMFCCDNFTNLYKTLKFKLVVYWIVVHFRIRFNVIPWNFKPCPRVSLSGQVKVELKCGMLEW